MRMSLSRLVVEKGRSVSLLSSHFFSGDSETERRREEGRGRGAAGGKERGRIKFELRIHLAVVDSRSNRNHRGGQNSNGRECRKNIVNFL